MLRENPFSGPEFTYEDYVKFPVGTRVRITCKWQDFNAFFGETGKVVRNAHRYLHIIVRFDEPRHFVDGTVQYEFGFEPDDLEILALPTEDNEWRPAFVVQGL